MKNNKLIQVSLQIRENHEEEIKELKEKIHKLKCGQGSESGITQLSNQQHHGSVVTSQLGSVGGNFGGSRRSGISSSKVTSFNCDVTMTSQSEGDDDVTKLMSRSELGERIGYLKKELQREEKVCFIVLLDCKNNFSR